MDFIWDETKRQITLRERQLDVADCAQVFAGATLRFCDERKEYGEQRFITVGFLRARMVVIVHIHRDRSTRIISMRYANAREKEKYQSRLA